MVNISSRSKKGFLVSTYKKLSASEKMLFLWHTYQDIKSIFNPGALIQTEKSEIAKDLLEQIKKYSFTQQLKIEHKILNNQGSLFSYVYSSFSGDVKLYFWYLLAQEMEMGNIIPVPDDCSLTVDVIGLLYQFNLMAFEQQIDVLKEALTLDNNL